MDEIEIDRGALIQTFLVESDEILGEMEQLLVRVEARPHDDELLHELFRAAHTLKGSASLVSFDAVRDLAHELEELLERLRAGTLSASSGLVTLLLRSVDALRQAVSDAASGAPPSPVWEALRTSLARAAAGERVEVVPAADTGETGSTRVGDGAAPRTLRVDVAKLDRMLDLSGEIATARGRLTDMLERRTSLTVEEILEAHREADRLYLDLQNLIMKARMVPIGPVFHQHLRTVRDIATSRRKQVRLVVEGAGVEVDTAIVEHIRDALTHMVRNAVDHGIEPPEVRRERGKDPSGRVTLLAAHDGRTIVIRVSDDGAGLDRARIAERAQAMGLVADASATTDDDVGRLVFEPGLSTSERVTDVSGRGVGMDVVRRNVEALRGSVSIESRLGHGTSITLRLPLTLAIIQGFRVGVAGESYILPLDTVIECIEVPADDASQPQATGILNLRGRPLPYLRLRHQFGLRGPPASRENVVVVQQGASLAGLAVDVLHGEAQTVIKPLAPMFRGVTGISGSSILGDGTVALVLDVAGLLRETLTRASA